MSLRPDSGLTSNQTSRFMCLKKLASSPQISCVDGLS